jgi:hypothetical protein
MYEDEKSAIAATLMNSQRSTPRQRLLSQQKELITMLKRVERAIAVMDANPGMEEFLEVTQGLL